VNEGIGKRIIAVWLLAMFAMPFPIRFAHLYQEEDCFGCKHTEKHHNPQHDCSTCAICQFTLSTFVEAEITGAVSIPVSVPVKQIIPYIKEVNDRIPTSYYLRGPPALFV
jgi:hypothetical protein